MATMFNTQKIPFTLTILNANGQPAQVDGIPVYSSSDETVVTLDIAADGMSGFAVAGVPGGPARFSVSVDADLGPGVSQLQAVSEDITVTLDPSNVASVLNFTLSAPIPK